MNKLLIRSYHKTDDCINTIVNRNSKLVEIPVPRKDFEAWLYEENRLWWQGVYGPVELSVADYWSEVFEDIKRNDLADYITAKGLVGDPFKDTFKSLQSICSGFKRSKEIAREETEVQAKEADEYYSHYLHQ